MAFARWQTHIVDTAGNVIDQPTISVWKEAAGSPVAVLYADRDGLVPLSNPFTLAPGSRGYAAFHAAGGAYKIRATYGSYEVEWRFVGIGTSSETDEGDDEAPELPAPISYTGLVATRGMMPVGFDDTKFQMNSRTRHFARDNILRMQLLFGNWYYSTSESNLGGGSDITISASLEYPVGKRTPLKWGGNSTVTITPGTNAPLTDAVFPFIPDGAEFYIRTYQDAPEGLVLCDVKHNAGGDQYESAVSALADKTASGTITNDASALYCYGPIAIVGTTTKPSVAILGDSRNHGGNSLAHLDVQSNRGNIAQQIGPHFGYINFAKGGQTLAQFVASHTLINAVIDAYCTDVDIQHGINDFIGGANAAAVQADLETVNGYYPTKNVWNATIEPVSTSSDSWVTGGNQTAAAWNAQRTAYNAAIRAGLPGVKGYFEFADCVETIRDSGIFRVVENGVAITSDGVHLNDNGHKWMTQMCVIDPRRIYERPDPIFRVATREECDVGQAFNKIVTPGGLNRFSFTAKKTAEQTGITAGSTNNITWDDITIENSGGGYWDVSNNRVIYPPKGRYRVYVRLCITAAIVDQSTSRVRLYRSNTEIATHISQHSGTTAFTVALFADNVVCDGTQGLDVRALITGTGDKTVDEDVRTIWTVVGY